MSNVGNVNTTSTLTADATEALNTVARVDNATRAMVSNIRQGVQLGIFAFQAMGAMIDQSLSLLIEAAFLAVEVGVAIHTGTAGISTVFQGAAIISMLILISQIKQQKTKQAQQTQGFVSFFRMAGFR